MSPIALSILGREVLRVGAPAPLVLAAAKPAETSVVIGQDIASRRSNFASRAKALDTGLRYACERAIANRFASLKYQVGTMQGGGFEPIEDHVFHQLWRKPNPVMGGSYLRRLMARLVIHSGACYVLVIRDGQGKPAYLWPLSAPRVRVKWSATAADVEYEYFSGTAKPMIFDGTEVLFFRDVHPDDPLGHFGPGNASEVMNDVDAQLWDYEREMFKSGIFNTWTVSYPKESTITRDQALELSERYGERARDKDRRQDPMILNDGAEVNDFSVGNDVTALAEVNEIVERRIRQIYGTPRGVLGDTDNQPRANLEGSMVIFGEVAIRPLCDLFDEELERILLPMYDPKLVGEFENPVPGDREFALREKQAMKAGGVITANEWRTAEGMEQIEGGDALQGAQPSAVTVNTAGSDPDAVAPEPVADVQAQALNGAQVDSLAGIVAQVTSGAMSKETAAAFIAIAFPTVTPEQIAALLGGIVVKEPEDDDPEDSSEPPEDTPEDDAEDQGEPEDDATEQQMALEADPQAVRLAKSRAFVAWQSKHEAKVLDALRGILERESKAVAAKVRKHAPKAMAMIAGCATKKHAKVILKDSSDIDAIVDMEDLAEEYKKLNPYLLELYTEAGKRAVQGYGVEFVVDARGIKRIGNHLERSTDAILKTTAEQIRATLEEGFLEGEGADSLASRIMDLYEGISRGRATVIARTETVAPANDGALQGYKLAGIKSKEWIAAEDDLTREAHAAVNGQIIPLDADFKVGNDSMSYPGDDRGSAENVCNCRCTIAAVDEGQE